MTEEEKQFREFYNFDEEEETTGQEPPEVLPPARITWIEIAVVFAVAALPSIYTSLIVRYPQFPPFWYAYPQLAIQTLSISAVVIYVMYRSGLSWKHYGLGRNGDLLGFNMFIAATIGGLGVLAYGGEFFRNLLEPEMAHRTFVPTLPTNAVEWAFLIFALLLNSIGEETAMRGFLTARLFDVTKSKAISCLVAGFVFGIYHLYQGWGAACAAILLGILFSGMFLSSRRLKSLILAHTVINILVYMMFTMNSRA